MTATIQIKRSSVAGKIPGAAALEVGELAVNFADKKIYTKEPGGTVIELGENVHRVITANDANPGLRITQKGTGSALLVEDEANPDATPFVVTADGNVGIGTATPNRLLVVTDGSGPGIEIGLVPDPAGKLPAILSYNRTTNAFGPLRIDAKNIDFTTKQTSRMTVEEDGHIRVNYQTATPPAATFGIRSLGDGGDYALDVKSASMVDLFQARDDGAMFIGTNGKSPINLTTASAANLYINPTTGLLQRSTSSLRYKRDVVDYDKGLDAVKALRPVYYKQKGTDIDGEPVNAQFAGLIAEEVDASGLKEFVEYDNQGRPDALQYANMVALLVKAVQEQQARIEKLEEKVSNLIPVTKTTRPKP